MKQKLSTLLADGLKAPAAVNGWNTGQKKAAKRYGRVFLLLLCFSFLFFFVVDFVLCLGGFIFTIYFFFFF